MEGLYSKNRPLFICTTKLTQGKVINDNASNILKMQSSRKNNNKESILNAVSGITLIALVVTIVVLLILASVSITVVFGDNGLIQMAKEAGEKTNEAVKNDKEQIEEIGDVINDYLEVPKTVEEAIKINYKFKENTDIIDKYGNPITIPAGFRIVPNGTDYVEYNYDEDENGSKTHIPTVQDGIVIEDAKENEYGEKNQFVWIPICTETKESDGRITIKRKIKNKSNTESEIILGRYIFMIGDYIEENSKYNGTGEKELMQDALNYENTSDNTKLADCLELENSSYGNIVAKSLSTFVTKANEKGGYYLARYEAVKGEDGKVKSKQSTKKQTESSDSSTVIPGMVWTDIVQPDASKISQKMYDNIEKFETDLMNSYAWDTAIVFIQTYSDNINYSGVTSRNKEKPSYTGERSSIVHSDLSETTTDKVCNIYDMASNVREWSTETKINEATPCVGRGGWCEAPTYYCSFRDPYSNNWPSNGYSFRPVLYIK